MSSVWEMEVCQTNPFPDSFKSLMFKNSIISGPTHMFLSKYIYSTEDTFFDIESMGLHKFCFLAWKKLFPREHLLSKVYLARRFPFLTSWISNLSLFTQE